MKTILTFLKTFEDFIDPNIIDDSELYPANLKRHKQLTRSDWKKIQIVGDERNEKNYRHILLKFPIGDEVGFIVENNNRIHTHFHFKMPDYLRGKGYGKAAYRKLLNYLGWFTSDLAASSEAMRIHRALSEEQDVYSIFWKTQQFEQRVVHFDSNTLQIEDIIKIAMDLTDIGLNKLMHKENIIMSKELYNVLKNYLDHDTNAKQVLEWQLKQKNYQKLDKNQKVEPGDLIIRYVNGEFGYWRVFHISPKEVHIRSKVNNKIDILVGPSPTRFWRK